MKLNGLRKWRVRHAMAWAVVPLGVARAHRVTTIHCGNRMRRNWAAALAVLALAIAAVLHAPQPAWAAKLTCLTGTDPSVVSDLSKIVGVRTSVEAACPASAFDGSKGKTHAKYVSCAKKVIAAAAAAGTLRQQCKTTVATYYSKSTIGQLLSKNFAPCIKSSVGGKVTCSVEPTIFCTGQACPGFTTCIDAADTNLDGIVGIGDNGGCACTSGFQDNLDGTITDCDRHLMWEKQDASGGLHDEFQSTSSWAGLCGCATNACTGNEPMCQPNAAAASICAAHAGDVLGCAQCATGTCNADPFGNGLAVVGRATTTAWDWVAQLNAANFAGHRDWRIPGIGRDGGQPELESTLLPLCPPNPNGTDVSCGLPPFNTSCTAGCSVDTCSCSIGIEKWSSTTTAADPTGVWEAQVSGNPGSSPPSIFRSSKWGYVGNVRAVRNGSAPLPTAPPATATSAPTPSPTPTIPSGPAPTTTHAPAATPTPVTGCCSYFVAATAFFTCSSPTTQAACAMENMGMFHPGMSCISGIDGPTCQ